MSNNLYHNMELISGVNYYGKRVKEFQTDFGILYVVHATFYASENLNLTILYYNIHESPSIILDGYVIPSNPEEVYFSKLIEYGGVDELKKFIKALVDCSLYEAINENFKRKI